MFAAYIPSWTGALGSLPMQLLLVGFLVTAIFVYARDRYRTRTVVLTVSLGCALGVLGGLAWAWSVKGFTEWTTIAFFELNHSLVAVYLGVLAGWLLLEAIGYNCRRIGRTQSS